LIGFDEKKKKKDEKISTQHNPRTDKLIWEKGEVTAG
jgi:hypothetical protein